MNSKKKRLVHFSFENSTGQPSRASNTIKFFTLDEVEEKAKFLFLDSFSGKLLHTIYVKEQHDYTDEDGCWWTKVRQLNSKSIELCSGYQIVFPLFDGEVNDVVKRADGNLPSVFDKV